MIMCNQMLCARDRLVGASLVHGLMLMGSYVCAACGQAV